MLILFFEYKIATNKLKLIFLETWYYYDNDHQYRNTFILHMDIIKRTKYNIFLSPIRWFYDIEDLKMRNSSTWYEKVQPLSNISFD